MIEINLLPPAQKKHNFVFSLYDLLPYGYLLTVVIIILNLLVGGILITEYAAFSRIKSTWEHKHPEYESFTLLKNEISDLQRKVASLRSLTDPPITFSRFLYLLSSHLPNNVWFENITYRNDIFLLKGRAVDFDTDALTAIKKYTADLQKTEATKLFPIIEISSLQSEHRKNKNLVTYEIMFSRKMDEPKAPRAMRQRK